MILITKESLDVTAMLAAVMRRDAGAVVLFLGTTREWTRGRQTTSLEYEAHESLARAELSRLELAARERWPSLVEVQVAHRLGNVPVGEVSVAVAVSAAHRQEAFESGQWLIDRLKETVPIWKRENWADGTEEWVHPGTTIESSP
ncbi:MAG TPA: molybdenum cofactor biosynthesis protein MoaE [Pirellulaceae bacterium]